MVANFNSFSLPKEDEETKPKIGTSFNSFSVADNNTLFDDRLNFNLDTPTQMQSKLGLDYVPYTEEYDQSGVEAGKAARYGWYQGWSGALYTTSGIPGWIDRMNDATVDFFGGEGEAEKWTYDYLYGDDFVKNNGILGEQDFQNANGKLREKVLFKESLDNSILKKGTYHTLAAINGLEEWLKEKSVGMRPEEQEWYTGFKPQGIVEKTISGFASAPGAIATIAPATMLTGSPMLGFALVSFLDQYENDSAASIAWNTALGAVEGKAFGAVMGSPLSWKGKASGLGAIGAGSAAVHGGSYDDVISGAIVMGAFGVPFVSGTAKKLGIIKEKSSIDPAKEAEMNIMIKKGKDEVGETIHRTNAHKEPIVTFIENKSESGFTRETKREVIELDPRTGEARVSGKYDLGEYGNIEGLRPTKKTKKQIERGEDKITFEKLKEESKVENKDPTQEFQIDRIQEKDNATIAKKVEATRKSSEPVYEEISIPRDLVFKDGKLVDVYVKLDRNGRVIGLADPGVRVPRPIETISGKATKEANQSFAERFNFSQGKDGAVIAKLSDLIKIKKDKGIRIKATKGWLNKAIKDSIRLKETLESGFEGRVREYNKSLDTTLDTANVAYNTLLRVEGFKNIGLSKEADAIELKNVIFETDIAGKIGKDATKKKNERGEVEKDVNETQATGLIKALKGGLNFLERYTITPKFIGGPTSSRIIKAYVSAVEKMRMEIEQLVDTIDYKKRVVSDKKSIEDTKYILEEGTTKNGIKYWPATALSEPKVQRGLDGALTQIEALVQRGGKKEIASAVRIMEARIKRDDIMYQEAINNVKGRKSNEKVEKEYLERNPDGTFKYEMGYERMQKEFKLTEAELDIIRLMDAGLKIKLELYNSYAKKYADQGQKIIDARPNYDVRSWFGKERAFIKTREKVVLENGIELDAGKTVAVVPGHSRTELKEFMDNFLKDNPEFADGKKFETFYVTKEAVGEKSGVGVIDAFETSHQFFEILPTDVIAKIRTAEAKYRKKQALFKAPLQREGVRGFAGEQQGLTGLQYYLKAHRDYGVGAVRAAKSMEFKSNWEQHLYGKTGQLFRKNFPNQVKVTEMYIDNALGRNPAEVTKVLDKGVEIVSSHFRDVTSRVPYLDKLVPDVLATANKFALYKNLLLWTVRFMKAQVVQPWQVVVPKLEQLKKDYGIEGSTAYALAKSSYEIHARSDKQFLQALNIAVEKKAIDQLFLREFVETEGGMLKSKGQRKAKGALDVATGKTLSGALERYSRMQAFAQMYYFLESAKRDQVVGRKEMINEAIELTNNLMVQYDYRNRAFMYGNQGLGKIGPVVGLFKTFQHNYFGKTLEYFRTWSRSGFSRKDFFKDIEPLLFHFQAQVLTAGMFGIMAMEQADWMIDTLNSYFTSVGKEAPFLTPSELILRSELPMSVKFGLPSSTLGGDLSSTLAAPGIGLSNVLSSPSLSFFFGLEENNHAGVVGEALHLTTKKIAGTLTDADVYKYLKVVSPAIIQGEIDRRWGITGESRAGVPLSEIFGLTDPTKPLMHDALNNVYYKKEKDKYIIKDPYKGMRGKIKRDAEGFIMKYLGGKSFEESLILKTMWASTKMSRQIKSKQEAYVIGAAQEIQNGRYDTAMFYLEGLMDIGYTYDEAMKKVLNRVKMMNNTVIDRIKGLDSGARTFQNTFIDDVLRNNKLDDSYFPGSAYE
mgnify:CR=1 FL=1